jgi:hypothetical protein
MRRDACNWHGFSALVLMDLEEEKVLITGGRKGTFCSCVCEGVWIEPGESSHRMWR